MKRKRRLVRVNHYDIIRGQVVRRDAFREVFVLAVADKYAMVRRPACKPFVVPEKDIMPDGFTPPIVLE